MSQGQPTRPHDQPPQSRWQGGGDQGIMFGDVFNVSRDLAWKPVAPGDASMMQSAETRALGQTAKGGAASTMQSAATFNERAGVVSHRDVTVAPAVQGVTITETDIPGAWIITERVAGQVVGQYVEQAPVPATTAARVVVQTKITNGESLEAAAHAAGDKPVDQSDAAAIQAADMRATGSNVIILGDLAVSAQSSTSYNA